MNLFSAGFRTLGFALTIVLPVLYSASSVEHEGESAPVPEFRSIRATEGVQLRLPDTGFDYRGVTVSGYRDRRLLVNYEKFANGESLGRFFRISPDDGKSFFPEVEITKLPGPDSELDIASMVLLREGVAAVGTRSGDVFFLRRPEQGRGWSTAVQINDELATVAASTQIVQGAGDRLYCAWIDTRRGFPLVYFSFSEDGGATWSPNKPVEYDFREGDQRSPRLLQVDGGRLVMLWEDWRDRRTLVDIRYSYTDDGGKHWSPSKKVNDDKGHVWQIDYSAVARGSQIYVAFSDFRDAGDAGDNDWNIYFARSDNNGTSFEKNVRVNDIVEGYDKIPILQIDDEGNLFCIWRSARQSLFGEVAVSYSPDGGSNWSPSKIVSDAPGSRDVSTIGCGLAGTGRLLCRWREDTENEFGYSVKTLELTDLPAAPASPAVSRHRQKTAPPRTGEVLFDDDFTGPDSGGWLVRDGVWLKIDGTYMGVATGPDKHFTSYAPFREPDSYVLEGRFKLDPVAHYIASIYFRSDETGRRRYVVSNQFRVGAWMSVKSDDKEDGPGRIGGRVLDESRYPFQRNRWYRFRLVVKPERVDYYVDGRLMLSAAEETELPPGRIGLGGHTPAPTYFDDIKVLALEE